MERPTYHIVKVDYEKEPIAHTFLTDSEGFLLVFDGSIKRLRKICHALWLSSRTDVSYKVVKKE